MKALEFFSFSLENEEKLYTAYENKLRSVKKEMSDELKKSASVPNPLSVNRTENA